MHAISIKPTGTPPPDAVDGGALALAGQFGSSEAIEGIDPTRLNKARGRLEFLYAEVARTWPGFIARPGQYQMMHAALLTFLSAKAPDDEDRQGNNLAQLEAGTGTGKTVAYCLAAIVASELLEKPVIVSTATVALQEQLFDRLSGMNRFPQRRALVVASPFDYATQGELRIAAMQHNPKSPGFSDELCQLLPDLLREHQHGQLVLFTSRRQMQACQAALPANLREQVQVQGEKSRTELLKEHGRRVAKGERSIIFGLQSFGEGIDLPGRLCEHVLIDKLPFMPPNSPVEEALAEWLNTQGRDPFAEISVPRAAMKLAQWAGRGVRTVTDRAVITVCDTRLATMRYGREILAGLPPFPVVRPPGR